MSEGVCNRCDGSGKTGPVHVNMGDKPHVWLDSMPCSTCDGTGKITADKAEAIALGAALKKRRVALGLSLYEYAPRVNLTPAQLSGLEHGKGGMAAWHHPFATTAHLIATQPDAPA